MKQIIILLFIVIIPSYLIAQESKWLEISKTKEGHPILMNTEMMKNDDYGVLVWFKYKMTSFKTKGINYKNCIMKFLYCFDCKKNKIEIRATYAYSEKGTLISSYKRPEYEIWYQPNPKFDKMQMLRDGLVSKITTAFIDANGVTKVNIEVLDLPKINFNLN